MSKGSGVKGKTVPQLVRSMNAAKRLAAHAQRSVQEQLAALDKRPGEARKERLKLLLAAPVELGPQESIQARRTARTRRRARRGAGGTK